MKSARMSRPAGPAHPSSIRERYDHLVEGTRASSRRIDVPDRGAVHVLEAGEGPCLVHLHGNNTSSLSHLMLLEHLTAVRTVLVDRPGFGLSDGPHLPRGRYRDQVVTFLSDLLDALGLESAVLVGASGGGVWALWTAIDRPQRVRGLVLLGSVPILPGARIPAGLRVLATPVVGPTLSRVAPPGPRMMRHLMRSMGEGETIIRHPELFESLLDAARDPVAAAANVADFRALLTPLGQRAATRISLEELQRVATPTLMIWGDHDPVVPVVQARRVAETMPRARLEVLPAGHVPQLGNPDRVARLLEEFAFTLG